MRTFFTVCLCALFLWTTIACGDDSEGPEVVTQKFLTHFYKKEFKEAKQFVSPNNLKELEVFEKAAKSRVVKPETPVIENLECITEGDSSVCTCTVNGTEEKLQLLRVDGKWLVNNPKEHQQRKNDRDPNKVEEIHVVDGGEQQHDHDH
jgi:hypothetical protein